MKTKIIIFVVMVVACVGIASAFSGSGTGSLADPFVITNCTQLQEMSNSLRANYSLGNSVDCADTVNWNSGAGFLPVGNSTTVFLGTLNGQNNLVSNLYISRNTTTYVGLFGRTLNATITNIGVSGNVNGSTYTGILVGYLQSSSVNNSYTLGRVQVQSNYVGGLAGYMYNSNISYSHSNTSVWSISTGSEGYAGGLVGSMDGTGYGSYITSSYASSNVTARMRLGGLVGQSAVGIISYSAAINTRVNGTYQAVAGLVGYHGTNCLIQNSYSTGNVYAYGSFDGGGLVGYTYGYIRDSYSRANVTCTSCTVGGLVATIGVGVAGMINNSYATGNLTSSNAGGVVGNAGSATYCKNLFWDNQTTGRSTSTCGVGRTTAQMKNLSTFTLINAAYLNESWDFVGNPNNDTLNANSWNISSTVNDGYPYLMGFGTSDTVPPVVNVTYPINGSRSAIAPTIINYTATDNAAVNACWYTTNGGVTNVSAASPGTNFSDVSGSEGWNTWKVSCNDSNSNIGSDSKTFLLDTGSPYFGTNGNLAVGVNVSFNYTINATDTFGLSCFTVNDTTRFSVNCSGYLRNATVLSLGNYYLNITVNDTVNNRNNTILSITVSDGIAPSVTLNAPGGNFTSGTSDPTNVTFNCSTTDNFGLQNISLYLTNSLNTSMSLNGTTSISGTSNFSTWNLNLSSGNYTWNCLSTDTSNNQAFGTNRSFTLTFYDRDGDGQPDNNDTLIGNSSSLNTSGITNPNVTVNNTPANGTYSGIQEVAFYDGSDMMVNFTHNFSASTLDLGRVTLIKGTRSLIVNFSGQVQTRFNKTMYIEDESFGSLCVKDADISDMSEMSSTCTGDNETDISTCIGSSTPSTFGSISCVDNGETIAVSNLRYSAIRGTVAGAPEEDSPEEEQRSGGVSRYIYEVFTDNGNVKLKFLTRGGIALSKIINDSKNTGVKEFEIVSKDWLTGDITIRDYEQLPEKCIIKDEENTRFYKALDFEHSFSNEKVREVRVRVGVDKKWIKENNISEIDIVRCYPEYKKLRASYVDETDDEGLYDVHSDGFSTFAILGSYNDNHSEVPILGKQLPYFWIVFGIIAAALFIMLMFVLRKKHMNLTEDLHMRNRWFDFEWKMKLKFNSTPPHQRKFEPH